VVDPQQNLARVARDGCQILAAWHLLAGMVAESLRGSLKKALSLLVEVAHRSPAAMLSQQP